MKKEPLLTLTHFVLRAEARKLYRECLRSLKGVDPATAAGVREAARERFADNAGVYDIKCALTARVPSRQCHLSHRGQSHSRPQSRQCRLDRRARLPQILGLCLLTGGILSTR